jgi:hypothetical protein
MSVQTRLTVAKWFEDLSLGTRLSFLVGFIVLVVVASVSYLEVRSYEDHIDQDLIDTSRLAARSAADAVAARPLPLDPLDIRDSLHDVVAADPVVDAISVIETDQNGHPRVLTSTSTEERAEVLSCGRAIATRRPRAIGTTRWRCSPYRCRIVGTMPSPSPLVWRVCSRPARTNFESHSGSPYRRSCS